MPESPDILRLRVLLCFLKRDETCTVMGISRTLKEAKQNISRAMIALEKDGLLDRSNPRCPTLTAPGYQKAKYYAERQSFLRDRAHNIVFIAAVQFFNRDFCHVCYLLGLVTHNISQTDAEVQTYLC